MRKLYNTKGKIHPSPPPSTTTHLSLLPVAVATLAAALSPEDQEVLAYLLSTSKPTNNSATNHPPQFNCNCFRCYTTFWVRWDASPNQKAIHEIIDAYEDGLLHNKKNGKNSKKDRKNNNLSSSSSSIPHAPHAAAESVTHAPPQMERKDSDDDDEDETSEKGSVRKIVSFISGRIWGVWGI